MLFRDTQKNIYIFWYDLRKFTDGQVDGEQSTQQTIWLLQEVITRSFFLRFIIKFLK